MDILLSLLLLLVVARIFGELAERVKSPALVGEILAGILLGPALLGILSPDTGMTILANLGIFFIVYLAALELTLEDMKRSIRDSGVYIALGAFTIPALAGTAVGSAFGMAATTAIFLGIALAFTALPVSIRILSDIGLLDTHFGRSIVAAGLLCDVAGLALIGVLINLGPSASFDVTAAAATALKFILFVMTMVSVDRIFRYRQGALGSWILRKTAQFTTKGAAFALPFLVALGFSLYADLLGLHFVVGAFFGTLLVSEHVIGDRRVDEVRKATSAITNGFLGPVFFAFIGLTFVASSLTDYGLVAAILTTAIAAKFLGGYLGAWWSKLPRRYRIATGIAMNGRGAMELVVATIGLELGLVDPSLFTILVLVGVATTLMTPIGLRLVLRTERPTALARWHGRTIEQPGKMNGGE